jgi:signal transduction histidine kinase/ActR/RegA family two-component response regulator
LNDAKLPWGRVLNAQNVELLANQLKHCTDSERLELLSAIQEKETYLKVLNNFAVNLIQISNYDDLVWYVAKEVVGRLGFLDCVIYRLDKESHTLIQVAATGEKNPGERMLLNPMRIPVGTGVTGRVAVQAMPIVIKDLSKYPNYVEDINPALSEICVPLIHGGEVFGVIDCEDPRANHFKDEHLDILTSVASMTSSKIKEGLVVKSLEANNRALQDKQNELEKALDDGEIARRANEAKDRFLANTSHELRTPLTGIMGMIDLLDKTELTSEQRELVDIAGKSSEALLAIINDVLDLAKMEAGKIALKEKPINPVATIKEAVEILRPKAEAKGLEYQVKLSEEDDVFMLADASRLRQILFNLVGNAIKFTSEGQILVTLDVKPQEASVSFELSVQDTGIGFAEEAAARIFSRFEQLDASSRKSAEGTGLGLAISTELAAMMGGQLDAESQVGEGSTFYFRATFPRHIAAKPVTETVQKLSEKPPKLDKHKPLKILVAEDHKINQLLISKLIKLFGWNATIVENGQMALDMLQEHDDFDLVLMDIRMPVMDGITATKEIRSWQDKKSKTPIVALTANALPSDAEDYMKAGVDAVVPKPINKELLQQTILTAL